MINIHVMEYRKEASRVRWSQSLTTPEAQWKEVSWRKRGRQPNLPLQPARGAPPTGIDREKKADLLKLCEMFSMSQDQRAYYSSLTLKPARPTAAARTEPECTEEQTSD